MDSILRDINREHGKMLSDISNLNRHYDQLQDFTYQYIRQTTIEFAKLVVDHPKSLLLIVETTRIFGEQGWAIDGRETEPIRFTSLSLTTGEIWDQLLHPTYTNSVNGEEYHGIWMSNLIEKPRLADIWPEVIERLNGKHIIIFGADWARSAIRTVQPAHLLALDNAACLHNKCKEYYREFYELSLEKVLAYQGIDKKRSQLKNSCERILMLERVIHNLAAGIEKQTQGAIDTEVSLDEHPF